MTIITAPFNSYADRAAFNLTPNSFASTLSYLAVELILFHKALHVTIFLPDCLLQFNNFYELPVLPCSIIASTF